MNISYIQPEPDQTELSRKARGARLECERLASQIESTIKRAIALAALMAAGCSGVPAEGIESAQSVDEIIDAGPEIPCGTGGHRVTTAFVSYGYYDSAQGLISCENFAYATAQSVCIYQTSEYQASLTNLCAGLTAASSCAYSIRIDMGHMHTDAVETDYYLDAAYSNLVALHSSCSTIGGKWVTQ
jgi:hypothetical protein